MKSLKGIEDYFSRRNVTSRFHAGDKDCPIFTRMPLDCFYVRRTLREACGNNRTSEIAVDRPAYFAKPESRRTRSKLEVLSKTALYLKGTRSWLIVRGRVLEPQDLHPKT